MNRILFAASLFWIAYFFHLKLSFKDFKKVGVAIYANGVDDIHSIYMKINNYADLIHIDIIDHTFNSNAANVLSYKSEVIRAYWNNKYIEAHIMSSNPMVWINEIIKYVNRIYIHVNINESIDKVIKLIKENKCECGLVIMKEDDVKYWEKYHELIDSLLILAIENPGYSGQNFKITSLELIKKLNDHPFRNKVSLNVDGGVNNENIKHLKSDYVISGSYILNGKDPIKNIMILQTSSQYESI